MTEAEVIDRINSTIKKNGKNAITGDEMNFVLKAIIQLIADAGGTVNWGDIEGTIADQLDLVAALNNKVDVVSGKGLSTNDFTNTLKTKLDGIEAGAEVNVKADWTATSGDAEILNKPTIPSIEALVPETRTINGLDLSENRVLTINNFGLFQSKFSIQPALTGTTTRTILATHTIPANILTGNDVLQISSVFQRNSGGSSSINLQIVFNSENSLPGLGENVVASISHATNIRTTPFERLKMSTDGQTLYIFGGSGTTDNATTASAPYSTFTLPSYESPIYFFIVATLLNSSDSEILINSNLKNF
jgi:hypothetical protein